MLLLQLHARNKGERDGYMGEGCVAGPVGPFRALTPWANNDTSTRVTRGKRGFVASAPDNGVAQFGVSIRWRMVADLS